LGEDGQTATTIVFSKEVHPEMYSQNSTHATSSLKLLHFGYVSGGKWGLNREVFDKPMEVEVARALESLSCFRWRKRRSKNVDIRWTLIEDVLKALLDLQPR